MHKDTRLCLPPLSPIIKLPYQVIHILCIHPPTDYSLTASTYTIHSILYTKMLILTTLLASLSLVSANLATVYWPVFSPTENTPWIQGQTNLISWETGGGTGVEVFDIQLHNVNETIMHGFLPIALRVPMEKKGRRGNWGGSLSVELGTEVTAGYVSLFGYHVHARTDGIDLDMS